MRRNRHGRWRARILAHYEATSAAGWPMNFACARERPRRRSRSSTVSAQNLYLAGFPRRPSRARNGSLSGHFAMQVRRRRGFGLQQYQIGFFVAGVPTVGDQIGLEWGRSRGNRTETLRSTPTLVDLSIRISSALPWRFLTASELPRRPITADAVRFTLTSTEGAGGAVAATAPVSYANRNLGDLLSGGSRTALINSAVVTYMPCAARPSLFQGIASTPDYVLSVRAFSSSPVDYSTSPFRGILDVYSLERVSLADSRTGLPEVDLYEVHRSVSGGMIAQPKRTVTIS